MQRAKQTLKYVIPLTLVIVLVLLYSNFKSVAKTMIVMLSVPVALDIWLIYLLHYNTSVAVWVGFIALAGVAAETGVVMIVYLDEVYERRLKEGKMTTAKDLYDSIIEGAVMRVRPKMTTVTAIMAGLLSNDSAPLATVFDYYGPTRLLPESDPAAATSRQVIR
jgi:Cu(I)/Ag(I) efflux system membrane protein CusA/SilA